MSDSKEAPKASEISGASRALLGVVIGMGVLIVIGLTILVYGLIQKASDPDFRFFKEESLSTGAESGTKRASPAVDDVRIDPAPDLPLDRTVEVPVMAPFGQLDIAVPAGSHMESAAIQGGLLLVRWAGQSDGVVIIDPRTGRVLGRITLRPEAP